MSHITAIKTEIRDVESLRAACRRLSLTEPALDTVELYGETVTGYCVHLWGWRYPVVCDVESGQVKFINFDEWGDRKRLDWLLQAYATAYAMAAAAKLAC